MSLSEPVKEFDGLLDRPENQPIIEFLKLYQPSAHTDIVQLLVESTSDIPDMTFYCPDTDNHAYYLAHTTDGVVFAAAIGMSALMYRLPKQAMSGALVKKGEIFKELGEPWVSFNPFWPDDDVESQVSMQQLKQWSKLAYHFALN